MSKNLRVMIEIALVAAIAVIFSTLKIYEAPFGGSISLVMVPIFILAYRQGVIPAITAGFMTGLLKILLGAYIVHPIQFVLDYPIAYMVLGLAGLFPFKEDQSFLKRSLTVSVGILFATSLRLLSHFISGIIWFGQYAPENMNTYLYTLVYNLYYLLPEMFISIVVTVLLVKQAPKTLLKQKPANFN